MIDERQLVDTPHDGKMKTARNLPDMANSNSSLEGYAAINEVNEESEIAQKAYELFLQRGGEHGYADDDWFRAEEEVRRRREALDA